MTRDKKDKEIWKLLYFEIDPNILYPCLQQNTIIIEQFKHEWNLGPTNYGRKLAQPSTLCTVAP